MTVSARFIWCFQFLCTSLWMVSVGLLLVRGISLTEDGFLIARASLILSGVYLVSSLYMLLQTRPKRLWLVILLVTLFPVAWALWLLIPWLF